MKTTTDQQLSSELQELYLENKQWFSDVLFMEDEIRFFQKLFDSVIPSVIKEEQISEVQFINASLNGLDNRKNELKHLIMKHQHLIEDILKSDDKKISLNLINENEAIITEIKSLFNSEKMIKKELYMLVEEVMVKDKAGHLLKA